MPVGDYCRKRKFFKGYVDYINCTVKDNPEKLLQEINDSYPSFYFTLEISNTKRGQAFLDVAGHVKEKE